MNVRFHLSVWGAVVGICSNAVLAQSLPDAGSVLQQIEGRQRPPPPELRRAPTTPTGPVAAPGGPTVTLRAIRFDGNTVLDTAQLERLVAPWLGQALAFAELEQAARAVADAYRQAGYLARAEFGPQDLTDGVATLRITEARFGKVRIEGERLSRLSPERLQQLVAAVQAEGALVHPPALDRALLLADDQAGVAVSGQFAPGAKPGETDLVLHTANLPLVSGKVLGDNAGARSTGTARLVAHIGLASPLSLGDQAALALVHSQGSDYANLAYTVPVGARGWQLGVNASRLDYRLVRPELRALDARGGSSAVELQASYPLVRSPTTNLYWSSSLADKRFDNKAMGVSTSDYTVRSGSLGLWANRLDAPDFLGGKGWTSASLAWTLGDLDLDGSPNQAADAAGPRAAGRFDVLRWQATRQQALGESGLNLSLRYGGQLASKNLDSSEKIYLGGPGGVRAYPVGEAGGSAGQVANLELQANVHRLVRLTAFVDWGQVTVNRSPYGTVGRQRYDLSGVGLALDLLGVPGLQTQLIWARRLGSHPNPLANGRDQDGSYKRNRFWLTAGVAL